MKVHGGAANRGPTIAPAEGRVLHAIRLVCVMMNAWWAPAIARRPDHPHKPLNVKGMND